MCRLKRSPLRNAGFGKAIADREELLVRLRSMLLGLRFHLSEGGGLRILLNVLCLFTLRDAGLFRVETSYRITLCITAFLGLHLALGNANLLLLASNSSDCTTEPTNSPCSDWNDRCDAC